MSDEKEQYEEIQKSLRLLAAFIDEVLPEGWGFNLLIFEFGKDGSMLYISNGERESMIKAMQKFIAKQP